MLRASGAPSPREHEFSFSDSDYKFIYRFIYDQTGIVLGDNKREMIYGRMARRLRANKLTSFAEYRDLLESDLGHEEMLQMVNALTTNLTKFFRENHHFEHLAGVTLKEAIGRANGRSARIRIWSAGCSSGQEPFSIAMTAHAAIPDLARHDLKILATDIDSNMVARGSAGEYSASEIESIPAELRRKYLASIEPDSKRYQFSDDVRGLITFKTLNLLHDWPMHGPFDAIFLRNVIIYFDRETQARLVDRVWGLLADGGYLYLGHSENLSRDSARFENCGRTIYRKRKT